MSGGIMGAFANAPPKGFRPKPKPEGDKPSGWQSSHCILLTAAPPPRKDSPPPKVAPKVSAKRQKELDDINRMMEDDDEPQGPGLQSSITRRKVNISELEEFPADEPVPPATEESQDTIATADSPQTAATDSQVDEPKRKRGKRKVLKKTTKRDEKGYLGSTRDIYEVNGQLRRTSTFTSRFRRMRRVMCRKVKRLHRRRVVRLLLWEIRRKGNKPLLAKRV